MNDILLAGRLAAQGFTPDEISRMRARGELHQVRRGAYRWAEETQLTPTAAHRHLIEATTPQLRTDAVVSHTSAAVLHGLPVWTADLGAVHLTRPRVGGGGKKRSPVTLHSHSLGAADVTEIDGIPVTSLARTVLDLASSLRFDRAVAAGDRALALGLVIEELGDLLAEHRRARGIGQARRVAAFIDGRSESPGESVSRVRCAEFGLPAPTPQLLISDGDTVVARSDFGWEELRTVGEFDGMVKYTELLREGETASQVVIREKEREDRIRALGWQVVRWIWADLAQFAGVRDALLAAFARGRRYV